MGWIEKRPNNFLNQNFVRQGLPAKSESVRFRFISLKCRHVSGEEVSVSLLYSRTMDRLNTPHPCVQEEAPR